MVSIIHKNSELFPWIYIKRKQQELRYYIQNPFVNRQTQCHIYDDISYNFVNDIKSFYVK